MNQDLFNCYEPEVRAEKPNPKSLQHRTGLTWPPKKGADPRLKELLATLRERAGGAGDHDELLWTICAAVWWLNHEEAKLAARQIAETLTARLGGGTTSPSRAA